MEMSSKYTHSAEIRAKISAANRGRVPWNAGRNHSDETRLKITEKTKEAMLKLKINKATTLGLTLEEYEQSKRDNKRKKQRKTPDGKLTEDGRKRISESLKNRWKDPIFREKIVSSFHHRPRNETTRQKISESVKRRWQDAEYRAKNVASSPSKEVRDKISAKLKSRWKDPEFRAYMKKSISTRDPDWNLKISEKIRAKWQEGAYRPSARKGAVDSPSKGEGLLAFRSMIKRSTTNAEVAVMIAVAMKDGAIDQMTLRELLGDAVWSQEKLRYCVSNNIPDDMKDSIDVELFEKWKALDESDLILMVSEVDLSNVRGIEEEEYDDYSMDDDGDIIEVYDEFGEMLSYTEAEYRKLMSNK